MCIQGVFHDQALVFKAFSSSLRAETIERNPLEIRIY